MSQDKDYAPDSSSQPSWYSPKLESPDGWEATRELLIQYSGIPPDKVVEHVNTIRDRAWAIYRYPCIGSFRFLDLSIKQAKEYPEVLQRVKDGQKLLDLGCCFGQDERRLVADGAPSQNLYACDVSPAFTSLGYDLFLDKSSLGVHFLTADVFDPSSELSALDGEIDIINASSFFHLFSYAQQVDVALRVVRLLKRQPGSLVFGRQMGNVNAGPMAGRVDNGGEKWRHNGESWAGMWREVGEKTGTKWRTYVEFDDAPGWSRSNMERFNSEGARPMRFACFLE